MRVLLVEDEMKVVRFVRKALQEHGLATETCSNGHEAVRLMLQGNFDAAVLDIMLPGLDGLAVLRLIRKRGSTLPVLLLSARSEVEDRIEGLNLGADDYLAKPFSTEELLARLHAIARRSSGRGQSVYEIGDLRLDLIRRELTRAGKVVDLTPREFTLIEYMMRTPGRVFTRTQICEAVWDYRFDPGTNVVDVNIQRLRRKIDGENLPRYIQTVRGVGYSIREEAH